MADSSWYRVERILSEKYEKRGARLEKLYEILWAPTWEPAKRINAQVPLIVKAYEKQKRKSHSNGESREVNAESHVKSGKQVSKQTRNSKKIKIVGVVSDNGRNVENSTLLVENVCSGEQWCMRYEDIKRDYSIELIEFFEGCVSGFTK